MSNFARYTNQDNTYEDIPASISMIGDDLSSLKEAMKDAQLEKDEEKLQQEIADKQTKIIELNKEKLQIKKDKDKEKQEKQWKDNVDNLLNDLKNHNSKISTNARNISTAADEELQRIDDRKNYERKKHNIKNVMSGDVSATDYIGKKVRNKFMKSNFYKEGKTVFGKKITGRDLSKKFLGVKNEVQNFRNKVTEKGGLVSGAFSFFRDKKLDKKYQKEEQLAKKLKDKNDLKVREAERYSDNLEKMEMAANGVDIRKKSFRQKVSENSKDKKLELNSNFELAETLQDTSKILDKVVYQKKNAGEELLNTSNNKIKKGVAEDRVKIKREEDIAESIQLTAKAVTQISKDLVDEQDTSIQKAQYDKEVSGNDFDMDLLLSNIEKLFNKKFKDIKDGMSCGGDGILDDMFGGDSDNDDPCKGKKGKALKKCRKKQKKSRLFSTSDSSKDKKTIKKESKVKKTPINTDSKNKTKDVKSTKAEVKSSKPDVKSTKAEVKSSKPDVKTTKAEVKSSKPDTKIKTTPKVDKTPIDKVNKKSKVKAVTNTVTNTVTDTAKGVAKGVAKGAAKLVPGLAVAMTAYDAYDGYQNPDEYLNIKEGQDVNTKHRASAATGSAVEGLTFGLVDGKNTAEGVNNALGNNPAIKKYEEMGIIDHDLIGKSEIDDWGKLKKLASYEIKEILDINDWSDRDNKKLKGALIAAMSREKPQDTTPKMSRIESLRINKKNIENSLVRIQGILDKSTNDAQKKGLKKTIESLKIGLKKTEEAIKTEETLNIGSKDRIKSTSKVPFKGEEKTEVEKLALKSKLAEQNLKDFEDQNQMTDANSKIITVKDEFGDDFEQRVYKDDK